MKKRTIDAINGYCIRDKEADEKFLISHGIRRLTANKDIQKMDENPETLLETLLVAAFPGGGYNDSDDYFIAQADGRQYLVVEHAGQWFVGDNYADPKTGRLVADGCPDGGQFDVAVSPEAVRISDILREKRYTKDNPLVLDKPVRVTQTFDMPGVLDFAEPLVERVWPEGGTVGLGTLYDGAPGKPISGTDIAINSYKQDENGYYTDESWCLKDLEEAIKDAFVKLPSVKTLCCILAKAVPVGTLELRENTEVRFLNAEGVPETFILSHIYSNSGTPLVRYHTDEGCFTDFAKDLAPEDIRDILRAIGHPLKDTDIPKPDWKFTYEEEYPDSAGYNCVGILRDKNSDSPFSCLFFHILKDNEDDEVETMHIYGSLYNLFNADCDEIAFPWTSENEDILVAYLNGLPDPVDICGDDGLLRQLEFIQPKKTDNQ